MRRPKQGPVISGDLQTPGDGASPAAGMLRGKLDLEHDTAQKALMTKPASQLGNKQLKAETRSSQQDSEACSRVGRPLPLPGPERQASCSPPPLSVTCVILKS